MDPNQPRQVVIGDVHGHFQGLLDLLALLEVEAGDQIYFLGDLIDRGPESAQVVEFVKQSGFTCLLGNHEQLMLAAFANKGNPDLVALQGWLYCGGRETLESYESSDHLQEHLTWMQTLPTYLDLGEIWLVHAGVHPHLPLEEQTAQEFCWIRGEFHRMGQPYFEDKLIITGHTITFNFAGVAPGQIAQGSGWLDIDTGAYHPKSGWLTALDLQQEQVYQVNVFDNVTQIRDLAAAVTPIKPRKIKALS